MKFALPDSQSSAADHQHVSTAAAQKVCDPLLAVPRPPYLNLREEQVSAQRQAVHGDSAAL